MAVYFLYDEKMRERKNDISLTEDKKFDVSINFEEIFMYENVTALLQFIIMEGEWGIKQALNVIDFLRYLRY